MVHHRTSHRKTGQNFIFLFLLPFFCSVNSLLEFTTAAHTLRQARVSHGCDGGGGGAVAVAKNTYGFDNRLADFVRADKVSRSENV